MSHIQVVPADGKKTTTMLIYKQGNKKDPSNWQSIALCNTMYKLYASCLTKRLYNWVDDNNAILPNQKGFLPHDGVFENDYILDQVLRKCIIKKRELFFPSLDISNAFESLLHWVIFEALRMLGAGETLINIIKDCYSDSYTQFRTSAGLSTPHVAATGLRQRHPLSGILFILAINFLIRRI